MTDSGLKKVAVFFELFDRNRSKTKTQFVHSAAERLDRYPGGNRAEGLAKTKRVEA